MKAWHIVLMGVGAIVLQVAIFFGILYGIFKMLQHFGVIG